MSTSRWWRPAGSAARSACARPAEESNDRLVVGSDRGIGLIEVLVGLAVGLTLTLAVLPLMLSLQKAGVDEADRSIQTAQARVAIARFERDTRTAAAAGCPFPIPGVIVEAAAKRLVMLVPREADAPPLLVAWEISGSNLMRRKGLCPAEPPAWFGNSLFFDHKTMLEGVRSGSSFTYMMGGQAIEPPLTPVESAAVDAVLLELRIAPNGREGVSEFTSTGRVGR